MLKGVPQDFLRVVFEQRLQLNPGAQALVDAARAGGAQDLARLGGVHVSLPSG